MQGVVVTTVFKFIADTAAYFKMVLGRNGDVTAVKQAMEISPEEQAVSRVVLPVSSEWTDVRSF